MARLSLLAILPALGLAHATTTELHTVGYSAWWATADAGYLNGAFADQARYLDEVVYFGEFRFDSGGNIVTADGGPILVEEAPGEWTWRTANWRVGSIQNVYNKVHDVSPGTAVTFTIGGWGNAQNFAIFSDGNDPGGVKALNAATQVRAILDRSGGRLRGVDLDWEDGDGVSDPMAGNEDSYANLTAAIRAVLNPGESLTVAIQHNRYSSGLAVISHVDVLRPFTYDAPEFDGNHTSLLAAQTILGNWMARGVPSGKLAAGIGFFARPLVNPWSNSDTYTSLDHAHLSNQGTWLPDELTSYLGWGFDGVGSIQAKASWAKSEGLHSLFAWELSQDNRQAAPNPGGTSHYLALTEALAASAADPAKAVQLLNTIFDFSASEVSLTWNSQIGESYTIQATGSLAPDSWVGLVSSLPATDGNLMTHSFSDPAIATQPQRLYRVGRQ